MIILVTIISKRNRDILQLVIYFYVLQSTRIIHHSPINNITCRFFSNCYSSIPTGKISRLEYTESYVE